jgi:hypothetical protein
VVVRVTCEGATRITTAHRIMGTDPGGPIVCSDPRSLIREAREAILTEAEVAPGPSTRAKARVFTCYANVILDAVDAATKEPLRTAVAPHVRSYQDLIHTDPRPWAPEAQATSKAEKVVTEAVKAGVFDAGMAAEILDRDDSITALRLSSVDRRVGALARLITDPRPDVWQTVRAALRDPNKATDPAAGAESVSHRSRVIAPLVVATLDLHDLCQADTALTALRRGFLPGELRSLDWQVTTRSFEELYRLVAEHLEEREGTWCADAKELIARFFPMVPMMGLVEADRGSAGAPRGSMTTIASRIATRRVGLALLREAYTAYMNQERPIRLDANGERVVVRSDLSDDGQVVPVYLRYVPKGMGERKDQDKEKANRLVRIILFPEAPEAQEVPKGSSRPEPAKAPVSSRARFLRMRDDLIGQLAVVDELLSDVLTFKDEQEKDPLIEIIGFGPNQGIIMEKTANRLIRAAGFAREDPPGAAKLIADADERANDEEPDQEEGDAEAEA